MIKAPAAKASPFPHFRVNHFDLWGFRIILLLLTLLAVLQLLDGFHDNLGVIWLP
jgi:hypothetical protein